MRAALLALLLAGCSSIPEGVVMTPDDAQACKADGCHVFTAAELVLLMKAVFQKGYEAGKNSI
jgi:hypothetical protein